MKYHETIDGILMDDGTEYYVCLDTIGIDPNNRIMGGFDDEITIWSKRPIPVPGSEEWGSDGSVEIPINHKIEIAEFMIKRWTEFLRELRGGE